MYRGLAAAIESRQMQMSLLMIGDAPVRVMVERAQLAEAVGYGAVWLADERFYREVYSCLTHFAAHTSKVLLGPCVTDPYSRHPALTAMAIATLDEISGQRATLGIGAGISGFTELGINRRKPARAIREMIEVIRTLLQGESVDFHGEIIDLYQGRLSFMPTRSAVPIYVASNGPLGQRVAGAIADGAIMEACASVSEAEAFTAEVTAGATRVGRDPKNIKKIARLNTCIAPEGSAARNAVRPMVARYLGAGRLRSKTLKEHGLELPAEALQTVAAASYAAGVTPYLSLLPLITDRHVNALTLAGTVEEVIEHVVVLVRAGIDEIMVKPFAPEGVTIEETIANFASRVWPQVMSSVG
ncbi:MAG: LLM class flavin-dependent oxidoreductase [Alphaproteobacteria bacterium]|nr:LLM class flavin-dependent oxidoreductase [Alphaproteobacteria bacterium]